MIFPSLTWAFNTQRPPQSWQQPVGTIVTSWSEVGRFPVMRTSGWGLPGMGVFVVGGVYDKAVPECNGGGREAMVNCQNDYPPSSAMVMLGV